ncbi:hypothetical protein PIB30_053151 [Stylosanthes scabra]|uniref:Uncharacterized protein n=1 Tax=Stylosanthes scabra TaxID=79078 RepID=A0ABU6RJC2_9FABA|nr:hypothetical protein [Stylosanthes scabra]
MITAAPTTDLATETVRSGAPFFGGEEHGHRPMERQWRGRRLSWGQRWSRSSTGEDEMDDSATAPRAKTNRMTTRRKCGGSTTTGQAATASLPPAQCVGLLLRSGKAGSPSRFGRPRQSPLKTGAGQDGLEKYRGFKMLAHPALWQVGGPRQKNEHLGPAGGPAGPAKALQLGDAGLASFLYSAGLKF